MDLSDVLQKHAAWLADDSGGEKADLREADLSGADLRMANLSDANLRWVDLREADLSGADLRMANLSEADLSGAKLRAADLRWADLSGADLRMANLSEADLSEAELTGADLRMANLSEANLRLADARGAKGPFATAQLGRHYAWAAGGRVGVGCEIHTWEEWRLNGELIGKINRYTDAEIERYMQWIKSLTWLFGGVSE